MKRYFFTCLFAATLLAGSAHAGWLKPRDYQVADNSQVYQQPAQQQQVYQAPAQQPVYQAPAQTTCQPVCNVTSQPVCQPIWHPDCQPACPPPVCQAPCQPVYCAPDCNTYCDPCCDISYDTCGTSLFGCWDGVWGAYGQFLWMGLYGEQLDYGAYVFGDPLEAPLFSHSSEILEPEFDWKPGVRLGVFYQSPDGGADVAFEWFYYRNSYGKTTEFLAPADGTFFLINSTYLYSPTDSFRVGLGDILSATLNSNTSFRINHFLVKYGSYLNWSCNLSFHPYVGPVYYETNQDLSVTLATAATAPTIVQLQTTRIDTQLRGLGAKIGADVSYQFWGDFDLIGDFGLTGVAGDYTMNRFFSSTLSDDGVTVDVFNDGIRKWTARAILDLSIGFRYSTCFCGGYLGFAQIEWEYHHLFDQTAYLLKDMSLGEDIFDGDGFKGFTRSNADLMIHGLSVAVGVAF